MANVIDGKAIAEKIKGEIAEEVARMVKEGMRAPHLAAILVGNDGASMTYVGHKEKACERVGLKSTVYRLERNTSQQQLLSLIREINDDDNIDGLIVQLPLPEGLDEQLVINTISADKDVDGFHPFNTGKMMLGLPSFLPATPYGIMTLLKESKIETRGKHCVIIGRSNIVGKPMANLLSAKGEGADCTVTLCHSRTPDLKHFTLDADIIIAALGHPKFLTADMVKPGAVIIDVGITRVEDKSKKSGFRLQGDVDYENVAPIASYITPVPGGVGPMTIVSLLKNTVAASKIRQARK
ncbi:MAG: bifunctional methylenetetrahydrofolate dehydrogenase/methenyltetrahydrofolate cyclohydrolase FolD [Bacteroidetes bacterium]|uniref:Bifunctional protein FolD n=1 Tax=Candidatus Egerieousia excrementavium TaxID=2840778 RepID=A0A9D9DL95_9BACT|nr:bifunctional methylenetetrahydrofolate dehydrogenase/methenyltetrahydrofolate cyclohydrolase FolD [Candidatus Egerieousia excrementavium]